MTAERPRERLVAALRELRLTLLVTGVTVALVLAVMALPAHS